MKTLRTPQVVLHLGRIGLAAVDIASYRTCSPAPWLPRQHRARHECEMSRSNHGAASKATWAFAFTTQARPHTRSAVMGLWGMAEEPFWPHGNGSSASMTSDC